MDINMTSGSGTEHRHQCDPQHGLQCQYRPWMSTRLSAITWAIDTVIDFGHHNVIDIKLLWGNMGHRHQCSHWQHHGPLTSTWLQVAAHTMNIHITFSGDMGHIGHAHCSRTKDSVTAEPIHINMASCGSSGLRYWHDSASLHSINTTSISPSFPPIYGKFVHCSGIRSCNALLSIFLYPYNSLWVIGQAEDLWSLKLCKYQIIA